MAAYRNALPQLTGELFLADAGVETDLIFNHGIDIPHFAAHTLLIDDTGRLALANYFRDFLRLAQASDAGFILDSPTWKAHSHWGHDLAASDEQLREANRQAIAFIAGLREEFSGNARPIVLNAIIGPRGDAYATGQKLAEAEAEAYHSKQLGWLAETEADMVTATTFTQAGEAIGLVRAAGHYGLPVVVSFTVETDGSLPSGQSLSEAIEQVDAATGSAAAYFMVNCAHPDHFSHVLTDAPWARRIRGLRCNASRKSHAELDQCTVLDDGNPSELAEQYRGFRSAMPWVNIFGGCCGSDLRHVTCIAHMLTT